jgi:hypothetical protein
MSKDHKDIGYPVTSMFKQGVPKHAIGKQFNLTEDEVDAVLRDNGICVKCVS